MKSLILLILARHTETVFQASCLIVSIKMRAINKSKSEYQQYFYVSFRFLELKNLFKMFFSFRVRYIIQSWSVKMIKFNLLVLTQPGKKNTFAIYPLWKYSKDTKSILPTSPIPFAFLLLFPFLYFSFKYSRLLHNPSLVCTVIISFQFPKFLVFFLFVEL